LGKTFLSDTIKTEPFITAKWTKTQIMERNERIAVLDGLRAWAIILVVLHHWLETIIPYKDVFKFFSESPLRLGTIPANGWMGVDLFFVLSGYLISTQLLGRYYDDQNHRVLVFPFLKRRLWRIVPAYYAILTLLATGYVDGFPFPAGMEHIGFRYFYHLIFMQDYFPSDILPIFWSLAVELKFYIFAPFLVALLLKMKNEKVQIFFMVLLLCALPVTRFFFSVEHPEIKDFGAYDEHIRTVFHFQLDGLLAGMLCAILLKSDAVRQVIANPFAATILFFFGFSIILLFNFSGYHFYDEVSLFEKTFIPTILAVGFSFMLISLISGCIATSFFAWKGLAPIALVSYSAYLIHYVLLSYIKAILYVAIPNFGEFSLPMQYVASIPLAAVPIAILSWASWKFIERPFMEMGNRSHQKDCRESKERQEPDNVGDGR
jgi:peptidoglycan/LPS O-acetylase OafA/YrhL